MSLIVSTINELLEMRGEDEVSSVLSSFRCAKNPDIETFARHKALDFNRQGIAVTYLVFSCDGESACLAGFYTLAIKIASVSREGLSKGICRRLSKFSDSDSDESHFLVPMILIAQFGKNDAAGSCLAGSDLMGLALDSIREIQSKAGGRFVFLECDNAPKLLEFYRGEGFAEFGLRRLEPDDESLGVHELVQLFRFLRN